MLEAIRPVARVSIEAGRRVDAGHGWAPALVVLCLTAVLSVPVMAADAASPRFRLGWSGTDAGGGAAAATRTALASAAVGELSAGFAALGAGRVLEPGAPQSAADSDGDGLLDSVERVLTTSPLLTDTDRDGLSDFVELEPDGDPDTYAPGIDTDPLNPDTDGDGLPDGVDPQPLVPATQQVPAMPWSFALLLALVLALTPLCGPRRRP